MKLYDKIIWGLFIKLMGKRGFSFHLFGDEYQDTVEAFGFTKPGFTLEKKDDSE